MNKKDMFIKEKLQQDKNISEKANKIFDNIKGEFKMENNERKVIKMSFNAFLAIAASVVIVGTVGVNLYAKSRGKPNLISSIEALVKKEENQSITENVELENYYESKYMGISFSYPKNWQDSTQTVTECNISNIAIPSEDSIDYSKTVVMYVRLITDKQGLTSEQRMEQIVNKSEKNTITIDGNKGYYCIAEDKEKGVIVQYIFVDVGSVGYEVQFFGERSVFDRYYATYKKMLETMKFVTPANTEKTNDSNKYVPLSIDTATKKVVNPETDIKSITDDGGYDLMSIRIENGKIYFVSKLSKEEWVNYGIADSQNKVKASKNYESEITGFSKKVVDVKCSWNGQTINEVYLVFLMEDGTLTYTTIQNLIKNSAVEGKVNDVSNIQRIYNCSVGYRDGGGFSGVVAIDNENNLYDIGYILFELNNKPNIVKTEMNNKYVPLSIDTATKKIVNPETDIKSITDDGGYDLMSIRIENGKIYFVSKLSKEEWVNYGIAGSQNEVKASKNYESEITGFSKKVVDVKCSWNGQTINEVYLVFLMEDGTLTYTTIQNLIKNSTVEGKVNNVLNIQRIYNCSVGYRDGGGFSSVVAIDNEDNLYDIGYILFSAENKQ